jgi:hypothetical protein
LPKRVIGVYYRPVVRTLKRRGLVVATSGARPKRLPHAIAAAGVLAAIAGGAAPAASAGTLPDGRAWEMVSPVEKFGGDAIVLDTSTASPFAVASDGNGAMYASSSGFADAQSAVNPVYYYSRRTASGWTTHSPLPKLPGNPVDSSNVWPTPSAGGFSDDASQVVLGQGNFGLTPDGLDGFHRGIYLATPTAFSLLSGATVPSPLQPASVYGVGSSSDFSHIVFQATPSDPTTETVRLVPEDAMRNLGAGLYEKVNGQLRAVGILPDGSVPADGATAATTHFPATAGQSVTPGLFGVSTDGSHIFFQSPDPNAGSADPTQLYVRIDGARSVLVSASQIPGHLGEESPDGATFISASPDGSTVWFSTRSQLTPDSPADGTLRVYQANVASGSLAYMPDLDAAAGPLTASDDGSRFLYIKAGTNELWLSDHGQLTRIADPVTPSIGFRASLDGSRFVFSTSAAVAGFNNGGVAQVYVYDVASAKLSCASCPPDGQTPTGPVEFAPVFNGVGNGSTWTQPRGTTADASRVVFDTPDSLSPLDVNDRRDVYEWEDGSVKLLSSGKGAFDSRVLDTSATGDDVFFATRDDLVPQDSDGNLDVYDARVNGGFPPSSGPAPCNGDCKGPSTAAPFLTLPGSVSFDGPGNLDEPTPRVPAPKPSFTVATISKKAQIKLARTGRLTVSVKATAAGTVRIQLTAHAGKRWTGPAATKKALRAAGTTRFVVKLNKAEKRYLARHGKLAVRVDVGYSATGGVKRSAFTLHAPAKRKHTSHRSGGRHA